MRTTISFKVILQLFINISKILLLICAQNLQIFSPFDPAAYLHLFGIQCVPGISFRPWCLVRDFFAMDTIITFCACEMLHVRDIFSNMCVCLGQPLRLRLSHHQNQVFFFLDILISLWGLFGEITQQQHLLMLPISARNYLFFSLNSENVWK